MDKSKSVQSQVVKDEEKIVTVLHSPYAVLWIKLELTFFTMPIFSLNEWILHQNKENHFDKYRNIPSRTGWLKRRFRFGWNILRISPKSSPKDPLLLLLDNHSLHISLQTYFYNKEKGTTMVFILPHTPYIFQTFGIASCYTLRSANDKECDNFTERHSREETSPSHHLCFEWILYETNQIHKCNTSI